LLYTRAICIHFRVNAVSLIPFLICNLSGCSSFGALLSAQLLPGAITTTFYFPCCRYLCYCNGCCSRWYLSCGLALLPRSSPFPFRFHFTCHHLSGRNACQVHDAGDCRMIRTSDPTSLFRSRYHASHSHSKRVHCSPSFCPWVW